MDKLEETIVNKLLNNDAHEIEILEAQLKEAIDVIKEYQYGWDHGDLAKDFMANHKKGGSDV